MPRRKAPRSYLEPWVATRSTTHGKCPFPDGIPESYPDGVGQALLEAWQRSEDNASWLVWGSQMHDLAICRNLDGSVAVMDDQGIIVTVGRKLGLPEGAPTQEQIAKRIAECVTALAGVGDPVAFIEDVRALLFGYAKGECEDPYTDTRFISLLSRCIPLEQLETFNDRDE